MAVVNALGLLENSPFKDASQFPLLEDPLWTLKQMTRRKNLTMKGMTA